MGVRSLFPTWQAIGYELFGIRGVFLVSPLFGALSVLVVFLLGRRLFGSVAGIAAAILLAISLPQLWFSRTPGSEVLFQFTLSSALLFWVLFSSTSHVLLGIFAGVGFGALALIRIDSAIVYGGIVTLFLYLMATNSLQRRDLFFIVPLLAIATLGLADAMYSSRPYVSLLYETTAGVTALLVAMSVVAVTAGVIAVWPQKGIKIRLVKLGKGHAFKIKVALAMGLIGLAFFAYFVRPNVQESISLTLEGIVIPRHAEESFVRLGWYLSPLGLAMATIGGAIAIVLSNNRGLALFLMISLAVTLYYLFDPRITPDHFWAARRYVLATIPMCLLFIGLVIQLVGWRQVTAWSPGSGEHHSDSRVAKRIQELWTAVPIHSAWLRLYRWLGARVYGKVIAVGLLAALVGLSVNQIWSFVPYSEQQGSVAQVELIAASFPEDAVIVFENASVGDLLAPPLKLIHGLETFVLGPPGGSNSYRTLCGPEHEYPSSGFPRSCILSVLEDAVSPRPFYWVATTASGQPKYVRDKFTKLESSGIKIEVPKLEQPFARLPKRSEVYQMGLGGIVYRLDR